MYDKLLTNLRNCYDCYCEGCKYEHLLEPGNFVKCMNALIKESTDAIENLQLYVDLYKDLTDTSKKTARELLNTQQKTAKWELHKDGSGTCSNCHRRQIAVWDMDNWQKYCGACGAKMIGTEQEENKPR